MAKIEECTHMELYDVAYADVELNGNKIVLCIYLRDILKEVVIKRVSVSASNISKFLKNNKMNSVLKLRRKCIRCLINKNNEINYISLSENDWVICKDLPIVIGGKDE